MRKIISPTILFLLPFIASAQSSAKDWYTKGMELKEKNDYESALTAFKNAISKKADLQEAYYQAGWCSVQLEKYEDGIDLLKKCEPASNENKKDKYNELAFAYYKIRNAKNAIEECNKTLDLFPQNETALRGLGNIYYDIEENHEKALYYFEKAVLVDEEGSKPIYYKIGWLYNDKQRFDDAIRIMLKAIEYDSEDSGYREEIGYAYYMKGEYEFAITQLNKAVSLDESSKLGYYYKGLCFIATNKKGEAMGMYYKLKELDSDDAGELLEKINGMK